MMTTANVNVRHNGQARQAMVMYGTPLIADAANKLMPTGGVMNPTVNAHTTYTPKCTGSKPRLVPIGNKIGIMIISAAMVSRKQPSTKSTKKIISTPVTYPDGIASM